MRTARQALDELLPNLRKAYFDCETLTIGGGEFTPEEYFALLRLVEKRLGNRLLSAKSVVKVRT